MLDVPPHLGDTLHSTVSLDVKANITRWLNTAFPKALPAWVPLLGNNA